MKSNLKVLLVATLSHEVDNDDRDQTFCVTVATALIVPGGATPQCYLSRLPLQRS